MPISELLLNVFFYMFAAAALGGGAAVAFSRNIVRSAFALLAVLFSVAAMYAFARADFIVVAQILIYVGGILVLIIFAIMLTHKITDVKISNESSPGLPAACACVCVFVLLILTFVYAHRWERGPKLIQASMPATEGRPPVAVDLAMTQGDGRTGVPPGGTVLDGFARLQVATRAQLTGIAVARFRIETFARASSTKAGAWKEYKPSDPKMLLAKVTDAGEEGRRASADLERLPEGRYRWSVRFEDEVGETGWAPFGARGEGDDADFVVEKGLTKALGRAFMGPYLLAFEVVSVLLLAALIGAAYLARKEVKE
jgi:NADH:ubiquinone oxidoreductase subunit 6 (subunit J)